jgi:hypothetical protein
VKHSTARAPSRDQVVRLDVFRTEPVRLLKLVRLTAAMDRQAFTRLYHALAPTVTVAAYSIVSDRIRADAVTSATFVEAWKSAQQHTARGTDVAAWIRDVAVRRAGAAPADDELRPRSELTRFLLSSEAPGRHLTDDGFLVDGRGISALPSAPA